MIADALRCLFDEGKKAAGADNQAKVLTIPGIPGKVAIVNAAGEVKWEETVPPQRSHTLGSLAEVKGFVDFVTSALSLKPSVWYSEEGIVVVVHDDVKSQRVDKATVKLTRTQAHRVLREIDDEWLPQKDFVRLLRVTLSDAATESSKRLLATSRVIAFSSTNGGRGTVELGRQSIDRSIEEEIKSEVGDVPELVTFSVRLFTDPNLTRRFTIPCVVDINPREGTFNLAPQAEAFEDAVDEQLSLIGQELAGELSCPVFRGRP